MKIVSNILKQNALTLYENEILHLIKKSVWGSSDLLWDADIKKGITGSCLSAPVGPELYELVVNSIKEHIPNCNNFTIQHYIWQKNAGISLHADGPYKLGATIYLNKNWDIDFGGIFVWKDMAEDLKSLSKNQYIGKLSAFCPTYNTMICNTNHSWHLVTPVSPLSLENRFTLQIWGK